jgi:protocatechuate 3,4-dioxygenase beta subunit
MGNFPTTIPALYGQAAHRVSMRGLSLVLTVAFVFASSALLVGPASAQSSTEPSSSPPYPGEEYRPEPTDAVLDGRVTDLSGNPVAGAQVSSYNHGPVYYAEGDASSSDDAGMSRPAYYGGNSTSTDADGRFRMGVYSGENQLSVWQDGYASRSVSVKVASGQTATQDVQLEKFPEKTSRIEGRVTDAKTGRGLPFVSISVSSPWYGVYECSMEEGSDSGSGGGAEPMPAEAEKSMIAPDYYRGCSITTHADGSFEGLVTPGYSIVSVYYDSWRACYGSTDADGSSSRTCGPEYFSFSRTLTLPANDTTRLDVKLQSHKAPDAVVSGYLVDAESGEAIPGAQISLHNQETYGSGYATTDGDGSYSLRLRAGYHSVSVWAPGHLPWEGILVVPAGDSDFDVELTPGEPSYGGGCCYAYAMDSKSSIGAAEGAAMPPAAMGANGGAVSSDDGTDADGNEQALYQDLGGGLGPYDAAQRGEQLDDSTESSNGAPGLGLVATLAALGAVALVLVRRRA